MGQGECLLFLLSLSARPYRVKTHPIYTKHDTNLPRTVNEVIFNKLELTSKFCLEKSLG